MEHTADLSSARRSAILVTLLTAGFMTAMSTTVTGTMIPVISRDFQITESLAQWITSGAMLLSGILIPITAFLIKRISNKRYFCFSVTLFASGSLFAFFSHRFAVLLCGRLLQAAACGMMLPFVQTILLSLFPRRSHGTVMAGYAMSSTLASIIGPAYAGLTIDHFGWRSVFLSLTVIAGALFLAGFVSIREVSKPEKARFHPISTGLSILGFSLFINGLNVLHAGQMLLGAAAVSIFVVIQLHSHPPMLELHVFRYPAFTAAVVLNLCIYLISMGSAVLLPLLAEKIYGHTAAAYGLSTVPGGLLSAAASLAAGKYFDKHNIGPLFFFSAVLYAVYTGIGMYFTSDGSLLYFSVAFALQSTALGILNPPLTALALSGLENDMRTDGSAVYSALRQISAAAASTLSILIQTRMGTAWVFYFYGGITVFLAVFMIISLHVIKQHKIPPE